MAIFQLKNILQVHQFLIKNICANIAKFIIACAKASFKFAISIQLFKNLSNWLIKQTLNLLSFQRFLIDEVANKVAQWLIQAGKDLYTLSKPRAIHLYQHIKQKAKENWKKWEPRVNKLLQISVGITSATSTLKLTIDIAPIILTMLTVLSALPLFGVILPKWLFEPIILFPVMAGISCYVGYRKYREEVKRAKLDRQILASKIQIRKLNSKMKNMEKCLNRYESMLLYKHKEGSTRRHPLRQQVRQRVHPRKKQSPQRLIGR